LPLPPKTTQAPPPKKPARCVTKGKAISKKGTALGWLALNIELLGVSKVQLEFFQGGGATTA